MCASFWCRGLVAALKLISPLSQNSRGTVGIGALGAHRRVMSTPRSSIMCCGYIRAVTIAAGFPVRIRPSLTKLAQNFLAKPDDWSSDFSRRRSGASGPSEPPRARDTQGHQLPRRVTGLITRAPRVQALMSCSTLISTNEVMTAHGMRSATHRGVACVFAQLSAGWTTEPAQSE